MNHISSAFRCLFVVCFIATISGCGFPVTTIDVTQNTKYHVGFIPGKIYELQQDAALFTCYGDGAKTHAYVNPRDGGLFAYVPKDCLYLTELGEFNRAHLSIVPKGSRVRIDNLQ